MKQIVRSQSIYNTPASKTLAIYCTTKCQLNCYYCDFGNGTHTSCDDLSVRKLQKFINIYDKLTHVSQRYKSRLPEHDTETINSHYNVTLTGGEPTYNNNIIDIIDILAHSKNIKVIYISTNGQADIDIYKHIAQICNTNNKIYKIIFSYHFNLINNSKMFLNKLSILNENNINCELRLIVDPLNVTSQVKSDIEYFVDNDKYHILKEISYITGHGLCSDTYIGSIKKQLDDKSSYGYIKVTYDDGSTEILSVSYIQSLNYNPFKGMYCESMYKHHAIMPKDYDLYPWCYSPNQIKQLPKFRKCFSESMVKDYISFIRCNYFTCQLDICKRDICILSRKWR